MQSHTGGACVTLPNLVVEASTICARHTAVTRGGNTTVRALGTQINIDIPAIIYYGLYA